MVNKQQLNDILSRVEFYRQSRHLNKQLNGEFLEKCFYVLGKESLLETTESKLNTATHIAIDYLLTIKDLSKVNVTIDYVAYEGTLEFTQMICSILRQAKDKDITLDLLPLCFTRIEVLGYGVWECFNEVLSEMESHTGYYDKTKAQFVENQGVSYRSGLEMLYDKDSIVEYDTHYEVNVSDKTETYAKWYVANFNNAKIEAKGLF